MNEPAGIYNAPVYSDALYRITYAWGLAFAPHVIKIMLLGSNGYQWDNRLGRGNLQKEIQLQSPTALARVKRADAAHQNGYESLLLFAPAAVAAVSTGVNKTDVDKYTKLYLGLRVVYNLIFILNGDSDAVALLRTAVWGGSMYSSIALLLRAARVMKAKGQ